MSTGLDRIELGGVNWTGMGPGGRPEWTSARSLKLRFVLLLLALMATAGGWFLLSGSHGGIVKSEPAHPMPAALQPAPAAGPTGKVAASDLPGAEATTAALPTLLDRLKISSQTWRRGGLGSNARVSFTIRNNNDYAVKDVEIACTFERRDGSHLTDRTRLVPGTIDMKSRKTFASLHVGYVNVNADKAQCAVISASRI